MRIMPRAWKERLQLWLIPWLVYVIVRLIYATVRVKVHGGEHRKAFLDRKAPYLLAIWHENVFFAPILCRGWNIGIVISASKDGEMITRLVNRFGHFAFRGSSTRGGRAALAGLRRHLASGGSGAITPDGPVGPRHKVKAGLISAAQSTKTPILPWHYEAERQWVLHKTWDKHKIPKPFSIVHVRMGEPIHVDQDLPANQFDGEVDRIEKLLLANSQACVALSNAKPL